MTHYRRLFFGVITVALTFNIQAKSAIDRYALVTRNNPHITQIDSLHSLTIGNGEFAFTADATGLQTFPEYYKNGLSLGTYSEWGWHSFPNTENYHISETLNNHPLPGHPNGIYSVQFPNGPERNAQAAEWFRANPHRLHLGNIGFEEMEIKDISRINQTLDMWNGELHSNFTWKKSPVKVITSCSGDMDIISASISAKNKPAIVIRFPYPTGEAADDASCWEADDKHATEIILSEPQRALIRRTVDSSIYYVEITWSGEAQLIQNKKNGLRLVPNNKDWTFNIGFYQQRPFTEQPSYQKNLQSANQCWNNYWNTTGVVDFSACTDQRAPLLERRIILSQYLLRSQEAQNYPPAETGLTYNTWYGKFHLEMTMWHSFHYALWNQATLLEKQLKWYKSAMPMAKEIADRQGFKGVRWMKMTDPTATEAPSDIGSFIIWQQPHVIYMAELIYRDNPNEAFLKEYADMVEQTAAFMASFVNYDKGKDRYIIKGACAANESYNEETTINPAFEIAYWHFGLSVAQKWRERLGQKRNLQWDNILAKLAPLTASPDGIYLPAEKGRGIPDFENGIPAERLPEAPAGGFINGQRPQNIANTPATSKYNHDPFYVTGTSSENLLAYGILPYSRLVEMDKLQKTLTRANENWDWTGGSWSWNYPPAVALMCAGWDGCNIKNPVFPQNGKWDVRWEGLKPLP